MNQEQPARPVGKGGLDQLAVVERDPFSFTFPGAGMEEFPGRVVERIYDMLAGLAGEPGDGKAEVPSVARPREPGYQRCDLARCRRRW